MKRLTSIFMNSALLAGASVVLRKLVWNEFNIEILAQAIIGGILTACILEFFLFRFLKVVGNSLTRTIPDPELSRHEKIVLTSGASHFKGVEAVGGKLTLTDSRLIFISHKMNIQNHRHEFPLSEIVDIKPDLGRKCNNMFSLGLMSHDIHRFAVEEPSLWIRSISHERQRGAI